MNKIFRILDVCSGTQSVKKAVTPIFKIDQWALTLSGFWNGYSKGVWVVQYGGIDIFSPIDKNIIIDLASPYTLDMIKDRLGDWKPDFIWASPTCTAWSIAAISHHFKVVYEGKKIIERIPTSNMAKVSLVMVKNIKELVKHFNVPFAIENPRGTLRKQPIFEEFHRDTAMYCKYGDTRMKPTDIWSNAQLNLRKCKNGNPCHIAAPRGSRTGTQGLKNNTERSVVPPQLIKEILFQLMGEGIANV